MEGTCLCESVTISASDSTEIEACHCDICRRWGGGPFLALHCGSGIQISGRKHIKTFSSSEWAERAFCSSCGTHLYYHLLPTDEYIVPAGLFSSAQGLEFKQQIFIDSKPDYYEFANQTENLTGEQVFEKFAQ